MAALDDLPVTWGLVGIIGSVAGGTAFLTWFVRDQFSQQKSLFFRVISRHNREDDDRFESLSTDLWTIREHLAEHGGKSLPPRRTFPRRRYLVDDGEGDDVSMEKG